MRKLLIIGSLLLLLFISSGQSYEQQSLVGTLQRLLPTKPFEGILSQLHIPYWGIIVSVEERGYYYFLEFLIRKSAHFFMFAAIASAIYYLFSNSRYRFLYASIGALCIALGDEYHQSLTGGRTATMQDVALDMAGALTALTVIAIWTRMRQRSRKTSF